MDGSLFKTIQVPVDPNAWIYRIEWISRTLFDNDPSNIEFLACYGTDSSSNTQYRTKVVREDGTILLDELHADLEGFFFSNWEPLIYATESGTKLKLDYAWAGWSSYYQSKVFNLPGNIPTGAMDNPQGFDKKLSLYPNPNNGSFFINVHSNNENNHIIDLYSTNGKLIETYQSSSNPIHINNFGLSEGIYLLNSRSNSINSTTKMIIKK
jgi:hypothetical protein